MVSRGEEGRRGIQFVATGVREEATLRRQSGVLLLWNLDGQVCGYVKLELVVRTAESMLRQVYSTGTDRRGQICRRKKANVGGHEPSRVKPAVRFLPSPRLST